MQFGGIDVSEDVSEVHIPSPDTALQRKFKPYYLETKCLNSRNPAVIKNKSLLY